MAPKKIKKDEQEDEQDEEQDDDDDDHEGDDYEEEDALSCLVRLMEEDAKKEELANSKCASKMHQVSGMHCVLA